MDSLVNQRMFENSSNPVMPVEIHGEVKDWAISDILKIRSQSRIKSSGLA